MRIVIIPGQVLGCERLWQSQRHRPEVPEASPLAYAVQSVLVTKELLSWAFVAGEEQLMQDVSVLHQQTFSCIIQTGRVARYQFVSCN